MAQRAPGGPSRESSRPAARANIIEETLTYNEKDLGCGPGGDGVANDEGRRYGRRVIAVTVRFATGG